MVRMAGRLRRKPTSGFYVRERDEAAMRPGGREGKKKKTKKNIAQSRATHHGPARWAGPKERKRAARRPASIISPTAHAKGGCCPAPRTRDDEVEGTTPRTRKTGNGLDIEGGRVPPIARPQKQRPGGFCLLSKGGRKHSKIHQADGLDRRQRIRDGVDL